MGEKTRRAVRRSRTVASRNNSIFAPEGLERRVLLSSAIAAFGLQQTFSVGSQPRAVAIADVNLDGKPDLLIANAVSNTVSVLLGNGNGTFQNQQTFAAGSGPFAVAVADVNLDGKPDLIVADNGANAVSVLLGNGNGTFQNPVSFATGTAPRSLAVADLNGDGKPDIAAANYSSNSVSILLGSGTGSFSAQQTFATGTQPRSLAIADVNVDGKPDLIIANHESNAVSVLLNSGAGAFPTQTTFTTGTSPFSVAMADVNLDGKPDILVANNGSNSVGVLLNTGTGSFAAQQTFAAGAGPIAIASADVNGDGKSDIVVANYNANTAGVLLGNGDGTFQAQKTFAVGAGPRSVAVGDLNRDSRLDLFFGNSASNTASALLGDVPPTVLSINRANPSGPGTSAGSVNFTVTFNEAVTGVVPGDFSLALSGGVTTSTPVVSGGPAVYTVTVAGISGTGTLGLNLIDNGAIRDVAGNSLEPGGIASFLAQSTFAAGGRPVSVVAADLNADGKLDLAVGNGGVTTLVGNGNGTFQARQTYLAGSSDQVLVSDVNGDGKPDLVLSCGPSPALYSPSGVLLGNGNGTFQPESRVVTGEAYRIAVVEVNGDGKTDLVALNSSSSGSAVVSVLLGNGNGTFLPRQTFLTGSPSFNMAIADVNGDGKPDVLLANYHSTDLSLLLGNGNGTFAAPQTVFGGGSPLNLTVADLNGDGKEDVVITNDGTYSAPTTSIDVLLGNGNGTFAAPQSFAVGLDPVEVAVADLNGDGKPDLVVTNGGFPSSNYQRSHSVSVLLSNGNGTFQPQQTFATGSAPFPVAIADVNGDGRPDLIVGNYKDDSVSVLLAGSSASFTGQTYQIVPATALAIDRSVPSAATTSATSLTFAVSFSGTVTGVAAADFQVITNGSTVATLPVAVSGSGAAYTITVNGVHGSGTLQLELIDNDTILGGNDVPLGGVGAGNGSFMGQTYTIQQIYPAILSIQRSNPQSTTTSASSVSFAVTFSEAVTGVAASDFQVVTSGSVSFSSPVVVSGSGASYTVTVNGIGGSGTLGLNLADGGTIHDAAGNPLQLVNSSLLLPQQTFSIGNPRIFALSDVNGDGRPDLVVPDSYTHVSVFPGNGDGSFEIRSQQFPIASLHLMATGDLNGDGNLDVVTTSGFTSAASAMLANGNGTFQPRLTLSIYRDATSIALADVNGDGKLDLLTTAKYGQGRVGVLLGNGDGSFGPEQTYATGRYPHAVVAADVNGDGKPDLIVANFYSNTVNVLLGNGDGNFQPARTFAAGSLPYAVAVADVNGDGTPDLIVDNRGYFGGPGTVSVLLGNGDGSFQPQQTFAAGTNPDSMSLVDVNGDGKLDLLLANRSTNGTVSLLLGNGDGTFAASRTMAVGRYPSWVGIADLNGDGRPDAVVANYGDSSLSVLLANPVANFTGQAYAIVPVLDTINGTSGNDTITLQRNMDGTDINWTMGASSGQFPANDPAGLTVNGNGGNDTIDLDYTNGNPLPSTVHLNGTFTINNLQGTNPLAGTTLDINRSTVFISYSSADPIAAIQGYLKNGYNAGAWNGVPSAATGVITSAAAAANLNHITGIGDADWADGQGVNTIPNTIELTYTLYGDANLDHQVNSADLQILLFSLNRPGAWDQGDFNYDAQVNSADLQSLLFTLNTSLGSQATPMAIAATPAATTAATAGGQHDPSASPVPPIQVVTSTAATTQAHPFKAPSRKRR